MFLLTEGLPCCDPPGFRQAPKKIPDRDAITPSELKEMRTWDRHIKLKRFNLGARIITYAIWGIPDYKYSTTYRCSSCRDEGSAFCCLRGVR